MDTGTLVMLMLAMFLMPVGIGALVSLWALPAWLRATAAGAQLTVFEVAGMKLRRIDVDAVAAAMAMADEHGAPVSHVYLQEAARAGTDLEAVTRAWIAASEHDPNLKFDDLHRMYREDRLEPRP